MGNITSLAWLPYNKDFKSYVAPVSINVASDNNWIVSTIGADQWSGENIVPRYVLVDNLFNDGQLLISFGPFVLRVPEFTRETYELPPTVVQLGISGTVGIVNLIFSTENIAPDLLNQFGILTAKGQALLFPRQIVIGDTNMTLNMRGKLLIFAPGSRMTFNLLDAASVPNGWFCFLNNNVDQQIFLKPTNPANLINDAFYWYNQPGATFDVPFRMNSRGDGGLLISDGTDWVFLGRTSFIYDLLFNFNTSFFSIYHTLWQRPFDIYLDWFLDFTTNLSTDNYRGGDKQHIDWYNQSGTTDFQLGMAELQLLAPPEIQLPLSKFVLNMRCNPPTVPQLVDKVNFTTENMNPNFRWQWNLFAYW